jgi:GTPase SAR1 family protein
LFLVFIIGTAGSGKSLLTAVYSEWLTLRDQNVITVNLDPGVLRLPYNPDVDVRNHVSVEQLMDRYELGPNSATVMAADLIATDITTLKREVEEFNADYVLIDTPGQMELFAFRASGPYIAEELTADPKMLLYLFDATFSAQPLNYVSNMFLATAISTRFLLPQLYVLSKVDLIPKREADRILRWGSRVGALRNDIEERLSGTKRLVSRGLVQLISRLGLTFTLIPISARDQSGFTNLDAVLTRIFAGGDELR